MSAEKMLLDALTTSKKTLALAESCTGGALAARLTAIPGASAAFLGSVVAYADAWKENFLGVSASRLRAAGAVSPEVVEAMVHGLFARTSCDVAAAISGIAGPGGGTPDKPVGTLYIALAKRGHTVHVTKLHAPGTRAENIEFATSAALRLLLTLVTGENPDGL